MAYAGATTAAPTHRPCRPDSTTPVACTAARYCASAVAATKEAATARAQAVDECPSFAMRLKSRPPRSEAAFHVGRRSDGEYHSPPRMKAESAAAVMATTDIVENERSRKW